jgi:3-dehydroquinate synthase
MISAIAVDLGPRSYTVHVGPDAITLLADTVEQLDPSSMAMITDSTVAELHAQAVLHQLNTPPMITFPAGEPHKTLATYSNLLDELFAIKPPLDRNSLFVALGGGVTGDITGFLAATFLRGVRFIQCPTTLLAAVDASVGGKTGVDHPTGKNLIGAFHQPSAVIIDTTLLATLPVAELQNGLAECVKHAVIRDAALLDFIATNADPILEADADVLATLIERNVTIKAAVVSADEREAGVRAHLNFGHTIGHALEVFFGYDALPHGQAVALGMIAANAIAIERNLLSPSDAQRVTDLLTHLGLPTTCNGLDTGAIWRIMQHDKKAIGGQVRMVLATGLGEVALFDDITDADVTTALDAITE